MPSRSSWPGGGRVGRADVDAEVAHGQHPRAGTASRPGRSGRRRWRCRGRGSRSRRRSGEQPASAPWRCGAGRTGRPTAAASARAPERRRGGRRVSTRTPPGGAETRRLPPSGLPSAPSHDGGQRSTGVAAANGRRAPRGVVDDPVDRRPRAVDRSASPAPGRRSSPTASTSRSHSVRNSRKLNSSRTSSASQPPIAARRVDLERQRRGRAGWPGVRADLLLVRGEVLAQLGRELVEVGEDPVEVAVLVDELGRGLLADARARPAGCRTGRPAARRTAGSRRA